MNSRQILATAALLLALSASGCRTTEKGFPRIINEPAPVSTEMRGSFGVLGVLPVAVGTNVHFTAPPNRDEAFDKVSDKTFDRTWDAIDAHGAKEIGGKIAVTVFVSLAAGTAAALIAGVSEPEFRRAQDALRTALAEESFDGGIQREITTALRGSSVKDVVVLPESALTNIDVTAGSRALVNLSRQGVDAVVDVQVTRVSFDFRRRELNPDMAFAPEVVVYIRRVADGTVLHATPFEYRGERRTVTSWGANNAKSFRAEMRAAEQEFARVILERYMSAAR
jgi:hypothetical protein